MIKSQPDTISSDSSGSSNSSGLGRPAATNELTGPPRIAIYTSEKDVVNQPFWQFIQIFEQISISLKQLPTNSL
jgi:hypothetical protein